METRSMKRRRRLIREMEDESRKVDEWAALPDELLLKIFKHLGQEDLLLGAGLVCTKWNKVAKDASLWKEVELHGGYVTLERAMELIPTMTQLKRVRLVNWNTPEIHPVLSLVADLCPGLELLGLNNCTFHSSQGLEHVAHTCKEIKDLNMMFVDIMDDCRHPLDVFAQSPNLEMMTLGIWDSHLVRSHDTIRSWCKLTDVRLYSYNRSCDEELRAVCSGAAKQLRKLSVDRVDRRESYQLLNQFSQLEDLDLTCRFRILEEGVSQLRNLCRLKVKIQEYATSDEIISFFSAKLVVEKLESLELYNFYALNDQCMSVIASNCPRLTHISLPFSPQATKNVLVNLFTKCQNLQSVTLRSVTYTSLSQVTV